MIQKLRAWPGSTTSLAFLILSSGCGGDAVAPGDAGEQPANGLVVSSPFRTIGQALSVSASRGPGSVAYVSMVPGSVPGGASLSIRNLSTGVTATAFMVDGGVDPVAIEAAEGDQLSIIVTDSAGHSTTSTESVKQRRPPRVVRTQPIKGSVDVPLNVRVTVVFSGPIDSTTVDSSAITVLQAGQPVPGPVILSPDGLSLSWTPRSPLAITTAYVAVLSPNLEDRNGFPVSGFEPVDFTTGSTIEDYGSLQIIVRTSGTPVLVVTDPVLPTTSWQLQVGGMTPYRIEPEDTVMIARMPSGRYDLAWKVSPNCSPNAAMPVQATVTAGVTSHVAAIFTCTPWNAQLQATIVSDGVSIPPEHRLVFRSSGYVTVISAPVPANGKAIIPLPETGKLYMVSVSSSNDQCRMTPSSQEVTAGPEGPVVMAFKVTCNTPTARNASIEVITRTSGTPVTSEAWEPAPMTIELSGFGRTTSLIVSPNDTMVVRDYSPLDYLITGEHQITWSGMPPNCAGVTESGPFQVVEGEVSHVTLTATCAPWTGRLQINLALTGSSYGGLIFRISREGSDDVFPATYIWPGLPGTVPLPPGDYVVWMDTTWFPCSTGDNPQRVTVGSSPAVLNFTLTCEVRTR